MSDDEKITEEFKAIFERFEKLEKKVSEEIEIRKARWQFLKSTVQTALLPYLVPINKKLGYNPKTGKFERIEKLEKWIEKEEILGKAMKIEMSNKLPDIMKGAKKELGIERIKKELSELKERVDGIYKSVHGIAPDEPDIIREVLRDHLNSHIKVAREQLTEKDKMTIFREFDNTIVNQLKKLDAKDSINYEQKYNTLKRKVFQASLKEGGDSEREYDIADGLQDSELEKIKGGETEMISSKVALQGVGELPAERMGDVGSNPTHTSKPPIDDHYDPNKEECEHNRPFWECEICGNVRMPKEKPPKIIEAKPQKVWYNKKQVKPPEPKLVSELEDMANITQIIEIYDNGHENVFYPDTHILVEKAKLEEWKQIMIYYLKDRWLRYSLRGIGLFEIAKEINKYLGEDKNERKT